MERSTKLLTGLAIIVLLFPVGVLLFQDTRQTGYTPNLRIGERITSYAASIELDQSGQAAVQEDIVYDFKDQLRGGFTRSLQRRFAFGGTTRLERGIQFISATRNGVLEATAPITNNDLTALQISSKLQAVSGTQRYRLNYLIQHAVTQEGDSDIVHFSPTDTTFPVAIDGTSVEVRGPVVPTSARCYVGSVQGKETSYCRTAEPLGQTVRFQTPRWLEAGEGIFIELTYPRGTFASTIPVDTRPQIPPWVVIVAAHLLIATLIWLVFGRDHRGRGVIIPSEELLEDIKPYEAGALLSQGSTYSSFVAMILDLAERKAIKINRYEGGGYISFDIERVPGKQQLDSVEQAVLHRFFQYSLDNGEGEEMGSATFGRHSGEAKRAYALYERKVHEQLVKRGWFTSNILVIYLVGAGIVAGWTAGLYLLLKGIVNDPQLHYMQIQIVLLLPFIYYLPRLTKAGALAREKVKGLAWYIRVAEKDRLAFHEGAHTVVIKPSRLVPYAVALGIQKDWGKLFLQGYGKTKTPKKQESND